MGAPSHTLGAPKIIVYKEITLDYQLEEISIELTRECMLQCIHCSSDGGCAMPNELTSDEIISILTQARELGATVVSFSGGDPILASDVTDYVHHAASLGYERILFYTEGVFDIFIGELYQQGFISTFVENWDFLDRLVAVGGDALTVIFSLHSYKPATHDYITAIPGSFYAVIDNIHELRRRGVDVEVHMVPMRPNYKDIPMLRDMCADIGVHKMSVLRFVPQGRGKLYTDQLDMTVEMFAEMQNIIKHELEMSHVVALRAGCPINFLHTIDDDIAKKINPCHAGKDLILVRPDGVVHPCAAWKTLPAEDNIRTSSLREIWEHGRVFDALRRWHEGGYAKVVGLCSKCGYQDSCKNGCPAQRLHACAATSMDGLYKPLPDPLCPMKLGKKRIR